MYNNGDEVIYRGQIHRVIICTKDTCMISDPVDAWDIADISELTPLIERNKEGKHLLQKYDD